MSPIEDLQKALDQFPVSAYQTMGNLKPISTTWQGEVIEEWLKDFKEKFAVFRREFDGKIQVDRKDLEDKLAVEEENWQTAKATSDCTQFTEEQSKVMETFGYIGNALAYANGRRKLLKELLWVSEEK